jgi:hypothetical protein
MAQEPKVAAATGSAAAGGGDLDQAAIQDAMDAAAADCFKKGVHDPEKVRDAKLKARERVKREHRDAQVKAARAAKQKS